MMEITLSVSIRIAGKGHRVDAAAPNDGAKFMGPSHSNATLTEGGGRGSDESVTKTA